MSCLRPMYVSFIVAIGAAEPASVN